MARRWLEAELGHKVSLEDGDKAKVVKVLFDALDKREVSKEVRRKAWCGQGFSDGEKMIKQSC